MLKVKGAKLQLITGDMYFGGCQQGVRIVESKWEWGEDMMPVEALMALFPATWFLLLFLQVGTTLHPHWDRSPSTRSYNLFPAEVLISEERAARTVCHYPQAPYSACLLEVLFVTTQSALSASAML